MSERPTAEILADLRCIADSDMEGDEITIAEAADRLEELDARVERLRSQMIDPPVCPTCGGGLIIGNPEQCHDCNTELCEDHRCPDCTDGRMPFERMARIVVAVWDDRLVTANSDPMGVFAYLRGIR